MQALPRIKATFQLDEIGKPVMIQQGSLRHYRIRLEVEGVPEDTYAVTYVLHETYHDPIRESRDRTKGFAEDLTSYGDYTVQAKIRTRGGVLTIASSLSIALATGHAGKLTPPVESALKDIREN